MGKYSEVFVAFDVAKKKHAVAIAEGEVVDRLHPVLLFPFLFLVSRRNTGGVGRAGDSTPLKEGNTCVTLHGA